MLLAAVLGGPAGAPVEARSSRQRQETRRWRDDPVTRDCLRRLDALEVRYRRVRRPGVAVAVEVRGPLGGITYEGMKRQPLVLDCSLVYSLARAGRFLRAQGIERVRYSSALQRRKIRGTDRWSQHSFGLAIDLHVFEGARVGTLVVRKDFEQGLGDAIDCIGKPLTRAGRVLRTLDCQMARSALFRLLLTPDYDSAHHDHFHVEARPWRDRQPALARQ